MAGRSAGRPGDDAGELDESLSNVSRCGGAFGGSARHGAGASRLRGPWCGGERDACRERVELGSSGTAWELAASRSHDDALVSLRKLEIHRDPRRRWETDRRELYDLGTDPGESRDLSAERPAEIARFHGLLRSHVELAKSLRGAEEGVEIDPDTQRLLESLGYLNH
jgi:hypothetical protein